MPYISKPVLSTLFLCKQVFGQSAFFSEEIVNFEEGKTGVDPVTQKTSLLNDLSKEVNKYARNLQMNTRFYLPKSLDLTQSPELYKKQLIKLNQFMERIYREIEFKKRDLLKQYKEAVKKHPEDSLPAISDIKYGLNNGLQFLPKIYPASMSALMRSIYQFNKQFAHLSEGYAENSEETLEEVVDEEKIIAITIKEYCEKYHYELLKEYNKTYSTNPNNIALLNLRNLKSEQLEQMKKAYPELRDLDHYVEMLLGIKSAPLRATMIKLVALEKVIAVASNEKSTVQDVQQVIFSNKQHLDICSNKQHPDIYGAKIGIKLIDDFIAAIRTILEDMGLWQKKQNLPQRLEAIAGIQKKGTNPDKRQANVFPCENDYHSSPTSSTAYPEEEGNGNSSKSSAEEECGDDACSHADLVEKTLTMM